MSKLLNKPLRTFIIYASIVLLTSVPVYFFAVDNIWLQELDENNEIIAERAVYQLERTDFRIHNSDSLFTFWNIIQPNARLEKLDRNKALPADTTYTIYKPHVNPDFKKFKDRFRVLERAFILDGNPCLLIVESNVEETYETVAVIAFITGVFFILLSAGFIVLNRRMSDRIWSPFRDTLHKLKNFRVDEGQTVTFAPGDILEFEELNRALERLMTRNTEVFRMQKEFTENASHELQTPLAIIQTQLGLLLQSDSISSDQYHIVEKANKALARAVRINKNLLLLAKVENNQFSAKEEVSIGSAVKEMVDLLEHEFHRRSLKSEVVVDENLIVYANRFLVTTVIQNLITNALRYCHQNGRVCITLGENRFTVCNSGDKELNKEKLFQRFTVLDEYNPGTGIGLALVHGICRQNDWDIAYSFDAGMHQFEIIFSPTGHGESFSF